MKFNKDTKIGEILQVAPEKAEILIDCGMHCIGCPASQMETLEEACEVHGIDVEEVIEKLNIRETEEELKNNITVSAEKNTQVIKIEVTNSNAKVAQDVANEIAKSFAVQVEDIYNINNVHVIEKAEETTTPYNVNHIKDIIMFAFGGFVIAGIYAIIANLLDTTVKTQDDIEKRTGLSVLVSIPMMNSFEDLPKPVKKGGTR